MVMNGRREVVVEREIKVAKFRNFAICSCHLIFNIL